MGGLLMFFGQSIKIKPPAKVQFGRPSRALTAGEIALASSVFGNQINYQAVRIQTAWWVLKGYAIAPNGAIYFNQADWSDDFSATTLAKRAWLIHELTHVWQYQKGMAVFWRALVNRQYRYVLMPNKPLTDYGIEQQAKLVEDFYIRRELGKDCRAWQACLPFF